MSEDKEFIKRHFDCIQLSLAVHGEKDIYISCYASDEGAFNIPGSNRWLRKVSKEHLEFFIKMKIIHSKTNEQKETTTDQH